MAWLTAIIGVVAGVGGILLGGFLSRRNERQAQGERLLIEAFNEAVSAIAEVSAGDTAAKTRYLSAVARIGLHSPPAVLGKFRAFQKDPTTEIADGQARLVEAIQAAREELGHERVANEDIGALLFGDASPPSA